MKAIKFVILVSGLIGLVSFFLPLAKRGDVTISPLGVIQGADAAKAAGNQIADELQDNIEETTQDTKASAKVSEMRDSFNEALDAAKVLVIVLFVPPILLVAIGGLGAARGKLGRLGGAGAMIIGLLGAALSGLVLAAFSATAFEADGGAAGIACYTLLLANMGGLIGGLLTLIKPDEGGKFA